MWSFSSVVRTAAIFAALQFATVTQSRAQMAQDALIDPEGAKLAIALVPLYESLAHHRLFAQPQENVPEFGRPITDLTRDDVCGCYFSDDGRASIIARMNRIVQHDAPWIFGFHPKSYTLAHTWLKNRKPMGVGNNALKYQRIDVAERERLRREWNPPLLWPLAILGLAAAGVIVPAVVAYRRRERRTVTR